MVDRPPVNREIGVVNSYDGDDDFSLIKIIQYGFTDTILLHAGSLSCRPFNINRADQTLANSSNRNT